jgi:hypothetical protein
VAERTERCSDRVQDQRYSGSSVVGPVSNPNLRPNPNEEERSVPLREPRVRRFDRRRVVTHHRASPRLRRQRGQLARAFGHQRQQGAEGVAALQRAKRGVRVPASDGRARHHLNGRNRQRTLSPRVAGCWWRQAPQQSLLGSESRAARAVYLHMSLPRIVLARALTSPSVQCPSAR